MLVCVLSEPRASSVLNVHWKLNLSNFTVLDKEWLTKGPRWEIRALDIIATTPRLPTGKWLVCCLLDRLVSDLLNHVECMFVVCDSYDYTVVGLYQWCDFCIISFKSYFAVKALKLRYLWFSNKFICKLSNANFRDFVYFSYFLRNFLNFLLCKNCVQSIRKFIQCCLCFIRCFFFVGQVKEDYCSEQNISHLTDISTSS